MSSKSSLSQSSVLRTGSRFLPQKLKSARIIATNCLYEKNASEGIPFPMATANEAVNKMFADEVYQVCESNNYRYSKLGFWHEVKISK